MSRKEEVTTPESIYKFLELVGASPELWEKADAAAVERAVETLRDLRIAKVVEMDMQIENGKLSLTVPR